MRRLTSLVLMFLVIPAFAADRPADTPASTPKDYDPMARKAVAITYLDQEWHDSARDREVPVKIYYPREGAGKIPVILFSPGLGENRDSYSFLCRYWAAEGYVVVAMTHHGSDTAAFLAKGLNHIEETFVEITSNVQNAFDRVGDVSFAIDELKKRNDDPKWPLHGRLDMDKVGLAGHSFGGNTAMAIAGQTFADKQGGKVFVDARVKCIVAMSPPVVVTKDEFEKSYAGITVPTLIMTGTKDNWPVSTTANDDRQAAFKFITHGPAYLLTLTGGDHFVFTGSHPGPGTFPDDKKHFQLIRSSSVAMFDAYLRGQDDARKWLDKPAGLEAFSTDRAATVVCRDPNTP